MINTEKQDPVLNLMTVSEKGGIERQEKQGQQQLVNSELLPVRVNSGDRSTLEKDGVVFGEPLDGDPMFCKCTLPKGWEKRGSDHDMWSYLVDDKGMERASMFYKAAFYDRSAHINIKKIEDS